MCDCKEDTDKLKSPLSFGNDNGGFISGWGAGRH